MELNPLSDADVQSLSTSLEVERRIMEETEGDQAKRIFQQYAPVAATQICRLAANASSERLKFQAATYVLDRAIGRLQDANLPENDDPLQNLIKDITKNLPADEIERIRQTVQGSAPGLTADPIEDEGGDS